MPELFTPAELFRGQPANFRIRLVPPDPEGVYQFRFEPVAAAPGDVGFVQEIITRVMRRGSVDADLEVRFTSLGERLLQYHFAAEPEDVYRSDRDAEEEPEGDTAAGEDSTGTGTTRTRTTRASAQTRTRSSRTKAGDDWQPLATVTVSEAPVPPRVDQTVALAVTPAPSSPDQELWFFIRRVTERMRFAEFHEFVQPRMAGARGIDWTDTGAYDLLQRLSKRFLQLAADPQRAVADPHDPSFGEISLRTAEAGVQRSYVSDEDLDLAQPFLGFDGVLTAAFDPFPDDDEDPDRPRRAARAGNGHHNGGREPDGNGERSRFAHHRHQVTAFPLPNVPFVELLWAYWMDECGLVQ